MTTELIVFDLAGTTVKDNSDVHRVLQSAMKAHDVHITLEEANEVMGIPKPIAIRTLLNKKYDGPITNTWIDELHKKFVSEMVWFYLTDPFVTEKEGVAETFYALKEKGIRIAVDTGFNRAIANAVLERMNWVGLIDCSVASDEVSRGRPFPELIFEAMKKTGIQDVSRVVKVGDTPYDIQEGKSAGCQMTIGITTGAFSREALLKEEPDGLIEEIPEVLTLLHIK